MKDFFGKQINLNDKVVTFGRDLIGQNILLFGTVIKLDNKKGVLVEIRNGLNEKVKEIFRSPTNVTIT